MKKLYKIEMTVYVVAKNQVQAIDAALGYETEVSPNDCNAQEVRTVPANWATAIPWGSDDDKTCEEFLKVEHETS